jgi:hypothetical protein
LGKFTKICRLAKTGASSVSANRTASAAAPPRHTSSPNISAGQRASASRRAIASMVAARAAAGGSIR